MKAKFNQRIFTYLLAIVLSSAVLVSMAVAAEPATLDEATVKAYLEKKTVADPGSCLVENTAMNIIGIADLVPGQQSEIYYDFEYILRCNRGKETKKGHGVLKAARLRSGQWIDRETAAIISK
jgi:hypothetical protein